MKTENYSPASQLASLLPHHDDIRILLESCEEKESLPWVGAIRRLTANIINNPNDSELWFELSRAFGLWPMVEWKYLFVAHRIAPENAKYLEYLAWSCERMGGHGQAIGLINKAIAIAENDADRLSFIEAK